MPTPTATCVAVYLGRSSSRRSSPRLAVSVFAYLPPWQSALISHWMTRQAGGL